MNNATTSRRSHLLLSLATVMLAILTATNQPAIGQGNAGSLTLPLAAAASDKKAVFSIKNNQGSITAAAIRGEGSIGVVGVSIWGNAGAGIAGVANGDTSAGVDGRSDKGVGVYGQSDHSIGVKGIFGPLPGTEIGILGQDGYGVYGQSQNKVGVKGVHGGKAETTFGTLGDIDIGVRGVSEAPGGKGVAGKAEGGANSVGVYGQSASGIAGFFRGKVTITESLLVMEVNAQKLTASKKLFTIDHPLDPANKFLSHSSVESNQMKDFYDGVAMLDDSGRARVSLPDWFEALNTDFRYQLTCIGQYAPVYVAQEVANHSFEIAGGKRGLKVSWQVTGIRRDAYARAHPLEVEQEKGPAERGRYLHPSEFGLPRSSGIGYQR